MIDHLDVYMYIYMHLIVYKFGTCIYVSKPYTENRKIQLCQKNNCYYIPGLSLLIIGNVSNMYLWQALHLAGLKSSLV